MGLTISRWGPSAWNWLHVIAHTAPETPTDAERDAYREFLYAFASYLPCAKCRAHFQSFLTRHLQTTDAFATRASFVEFMNDAHNEVNARLGKRVYTLEEHYRVYRTPKAFVLPVKPLLLGTAVGALLIALRYSGLLCVTKPQDRTNVRAGASGGSRS